MRFLPVCEASFLKMAAFCRETALAYHISEKIAILLFLPLIFLQKIVYYSYIPNEMLCDYV